jgi:hypothetical protein
MQRIYNSTGMARASAVVLGIAVVLPASQVPIVNGLPIANGLEYYFCCMSVVLTIFMSSIVDQDGGKARKLILVAGAFSIVAILLKVLLAIMPTTGLSGCYVIGTDASANSCAKSYNEPLADGYSRTESVLDFRSITEEGSSSETIDATTWELSAVNALELNYFKPSQPNRLRLPLRATWSGTFPQDDLITLQYVGEGQVALPTQLIELQPSYDSWQMVSLDGLAGVPFEIDFKWTPTEGSQPGPYAGARLISSASGLPVDFVDVDPALRLLGALIASLLIAAVSLGLWVAIRFLATTWRVLAVIATMALAGFAMQMGSLPLRTVPFLTLAFVCGCLLIRWSLGRSRTLLATSLVAPILAVGFVDAFSDAGASSVTYREGGNDFLTYEGQARTILEGNGLWGGESVFVYSSGFRYLVYLQHMIFGDSDTRIFTTSVLLLLIGAWFSIDSGMLSRISIGGLSEVRKLPSLSIQFASVLAASVLSVVTLCGVLWTQEVALSGRELLSEYPTWPMLLFALPTALLATKPRYLAMASAALGMALVVRANQALGLSLIILVMVVRILWSFRRGSEIDRNWVASRLTAAVAPFALIATLPSLHNLYYGGALVPIATSLPERVNFPLQISDLGRLSEDPSIFATLQSQVLGVVAFRTDASLMAIASGPMFIWLRIIQVGLILMLLWGVWNHFGGSSKAALLVGVPLAFLVPHFFIQVYSYYPRHIVQGYLAGAIILVFVTGGLLKSSLDSVSCVVPIAPTQGPRPDS